MDIDLVRYMLRQDWWYTSDHFEERLNERDISLSQVFEAIFNGNIIQTFPGRKPYPECIICGYVKRKVEIVTLTTPLYVLCAVGEVVTFITADWNVPREFGQKFRKGRR